MTRHIQGGRSVALLLLLLGAGCAHLSTLVRTDRILTATRFVVERHDAYLVNDPQLPDHQRETSLAESAQLLRMVTQNEEIAGLELAPLVSSVTGRHDDYVAKDTSVTAQIRSQSWLRSSQVMRDVVAGSIGREP